MNAAARAYIADLEPAQLIEGVYTVQNCQLGQTKNGKPFIKCLLSDKTGQAPGRMWNASESLFRTLPTNGFVKLTGQTQPYQGELQIIVQQMETAEPTEEQLSELLPSTWKDIDAMFAEVEAQLGKVRDPSLRALVQAYLQDEQLMARFRQSPAATTIHHAYLGGLLEHTLSLLQLADVFLPQYPQLNPDLVRVGLFIHDLGKCAELSWRSGFAYTDDGQLVGHIARGVVWLDKKAEACAQAGSPLKTEVRRVREHSSLPHHGQPEFGALKLPATPEAIAVSLLDNLDAKLQMAIGATRLEDPEKGQALGGHFTEKIWALNTRLYRPDPTSLP